MSRARPLLLAALLATACGGDAGTLVFVTVMDRPTVRPSRQLEVTVANGGSSKTEHFDYGNRDFPLTFTVTAEGRSGELTVDATALAADDTQVGLGRAVATLAEGERVDVSLQLDPTDFVVNSSVAGQQRLVFRNDFFGRQLAVHEGGRFLVVWENTCPLGRCDILGRLFDADANPVPNDVGMSADEFVVNQTTEVDTSPTVAAGTDGFLVAWVYPGADGETHLKAAAFDLDAGHVSPTETVLTSSGPSDDAPTVLARQGGGYVVVWERDREAPASGREIVARLLNEDGAVEGLEIVVAVEQDLDLRFPHGAGLADGGFAVAWTETTGTGDRRIRGRVYASTGAPVGTDISISPETAGEANLAHVIATTDGFVVGWQYYSGTQRLELRRFDQTGNALGDAVVLADPSSDLYSAPALASRADGTVGALWHDCDAEGDANGCGVHFALLDAELAVVAEDEIVNTTLPGNQEGPSLQATTDGFLAAWTDGSASPPDADETSVRARCLYPR